jgi:hypothetical protein
MRAAERRGHGSVLPATTGTDDRFVVGADKTAGARAHTRPPDWKSLEDLLGLLARAIQQLHTYPPTSPLCVNAIEACQRALSTLATRDALAFRVSPVELIVDEIPIGRGTQIEHELARRLHRASVASVTFDRSTTVRELSRFCSDLVRSSDRQAAQVDLLEMLTEHGIDSITVQMAHRPEVLDVGMTPAPVADEVLRERARFEAALAKGGGTVNYLYPPQKGWVRLDPSSSFRGISLVDLAVLTDDPAMLAAMLLRLTDEAPENDTPEAALERKYSDVAMLFSALDPRLARRMFSKLARAVLDLAPDNRQALLRRTILPGLLDGRVDGTILRDFPDMELAESLCLLLDLETAAPELLTTALARLELSEERHAAMVPLLEAKLQDREAAAAARGQQASLAKHARELVRVDAATGKSFADFAAFDLALDDEARAMLAHIRAAVPVSDVLVDQLTCLWQLTRLEPNPDVVGRYLDRSFAFLEALERAARDRELAPWLASYRAIAERVADARPDVAEAIDARLVAFCTPDRAAWLAELSLVEPDGRDAANAVVAALGPAAAVPLLNLVDRDEPAKDASRGGPAGRTGKDTARAAAQLLADHAARLAPALAPLVGQGTPTARRTIVRVLGLAGAGYERAVASQVASDEQTGREALRSLARIGTPQAGALVAEVIQQQRGTLGVAAEETLWHFPPAEALRHVRDLLGRREFTLRHPKAAERLLDRAARSGATGLEAVLQGLAPLRFRIWNPALVRVARKARAMLAR